MRFSGWFIGTKGAFPLFTEPESVTKIQTKKSYMHVSKLKVCLKKQQDDYPELVSVFPTGQQRSTEQNVPTTHLVVWALTSSQCETLPISFGSKSEAKQGMLQWDVGSTSRGGGGNLATQLIPKLVFRLTRISNFVKQESTPQRMHPQNIRTFTLKLDFSDTQYTSFC